MGDNDDRPNRSRCRSLLYYHKGFGAASSRRGRRGGRQPKNPTLGDNGPPTTHGQLHRCSGSIYTCFLLFMGSWGSSNSTFTYCDVLQLTVLQNHFLPYLCPYLLSLPTKPLSAVSLFISFVKPYKTTFSRIFVIQYVGVRTVTNDRYRTNSYARYRAQVLVDYVRHEFTSTAKPRTLTVQRATLWIDSLDLFRRD